MNLYDYFLANKDRPIHKSVHYFPIYERYFSGYRNRPVIMLEIGTGGGGSSQMWKRYFGPYARIVTLDIDPTRVEHEDEQVKVRIGDQSDTKFLSDVIEEFGTPDIILDDGSHVMEHVIATFRHLYPLMAHNGIYMVEDVHTSYWENYGGGLEAPGSFIELCKKLIDEINYDATAGRIPATKFSQQTISMQFFNSVVVFERGSYLDKSSIVTGASQTY